ncbi:FAP24 [Auxenochlorella protothecoides x Auxenochlorella symbiontica]
MTCRCILLVALVASASAASVFQRPINSDCVRVSTASTDASLFPNEFQISGTAVVNSDDYTEVETSTGFTVTYYDNYKVLNNTLAGEAYTLTQCGVSVAANELPSDARPFSIPLVSLSLPETVPYAFLELLGVTDRVYDVSEYVVAPCGQRLVQSCNRVAPDSLSLNNAALLSSTIGAYTDGLVTSSNSAWPTQFTFSATEDPGLLQRAEWIKFLGVFFNLDAYSSNLFTAIKNEFEQTKAAALAQEGPRPVVAWINHFMYGTQEWYQLSFAAYKTELVEAAGGQNLNYTDILEIEGVCPAHRVLAFRPGLCLGHQRDLCQPDPRPGGLPVGPGRGRHRDRRDLCCRPLHLPPGRVPAAVLQRRRLPYRRGRLVLRRKDPAHGRPDLRRRRPGLVRGRHPPPRQGPAGPCVNHPPRGPHRTAHPHLAAQHQGRPRRGDRRRLHHRRQRLQCQPLHHLPLHLFLRQRVARPPGDQPDDGGAAHGGQVHLRRLPRRMS